MLRFGVVGRHRKDAFRRVTNAVVVPHSLFHEATTAEELGSIGTDEENGGDLKPKESVNIGALASHNIWRIMTVAALPMPPL